MREHGQVLAQRRHDGDGARPQRLRSPGAHGDAVWPDVLPADAEDFPAPAAGEQRDPDRCADLLAGAVGQVLRKNSCFDSCSRMLNKGLRPFWPQKPVGAPGAGT